MSDKRIVLTTAGSREEAMKLANGLVERRAAACVNVTGPVDSVYWWQSKVERAQEYLLIVKTSAAAAEQVFDIIRELHSYDLPECVALPIESGSEEYLDWIGDNVNEE
jgi:periplasmic divalent cation tolerance protein